MLLDVSLIHFFVSLLSQIKHILGLADQRVHASTFECVRLCSEGNISSLLFFIEEKQTLFVESADNDIKKNWSPMLFP